MLTVAELPLDDIKLKYDLKLQTTSETWHSNTVQYDLKLRNVYSGPVWLEVLNFNKRCSTFVLFDKKFQILD
jgi:hypothetical protein